jgi:hypothetical protein
MLPLSGTEPTLLLIEAEAPLVDVQANVAFDPAVIVVGEAVRVTVGGCRVLAAELPHPLHTPVAKLKTTMSNNRPEF